MAKNGEVNETFGVYQNVCCGAEIVISAGSTFPGCTKHPKLTTIWQPLDFEMIHITEIKKKSESDPA